MDATATAKMILRNLHSAHRAEQEYAIVDGRNNPYVSQRFYQQVEDNLSRLGFTRLGDISNLTLEKYGKPELRTFIRVMVDRDRTTMAGFFHVAPRWYWRLAMWLLRFPAKCVEFESHSQDDCWYTTTNVTKKTEQPHPQNVAIDYAPRRLTIAELYDRHRETLAASRRSFDRFHTLEDAIRHEQAQHATKRQHLVGIGWVTPEYLARQGVPRSQVSAVYEASQRLLAAGYDGTLDS
jgi:hypothetical protein